RVGFAAALATLRKHRQHKVGDHLKRIGGRVKKGWQDASSRVGLPIDVTGIAPLGHFQFKIDGAQELRTLFTQMMLDRGILASGSFYAMYAHNDAHVDRYLEAVSDIFGELKKAVENRSVTQLLRGPVAHTGFSRLT